MKLLTPEGMQRGFHVDYCESYNAEVAADGSMHALAWFRQHRVA